VPALHARLAGVDPKAAAKIHTNDLRRIVRALEVFESSGKPISTWQREWNREQPADGPEVLCLDVPRAELYARIDRRVLAMLDAGWLDEARELRRQARPPSREASAAVGYRDLWAFLDGKAGWEETVARIQQRTRNYAKRQLTWFRQLPEIRFATPELTFERWRSKMNEPS
jgi:tRNA dimethylallyltransferase